MKCDGLKREKDELSDKLKKTEENEKTLKGDNHIMRKNFKILEHKYRALKGIISLRDDELKAVKFDLKKNQFELKKHLEDSKRKENGENQDDDEDDDDVEVLKYVNKEDKERQDKGDINDNAKSDKT